jgi:hypothetical protein
VSKNILLRGGVDQLTPRAICPDGSLDDCFNYEVGRDFGLTNIEGFEAFDGHMSPSTRDIWELTLANSAIAAAYSSKSYLADEDATPLGVRLSGDGTKMYVLGATNNRIYQYTMSTAGDASTAVYASKSLDISGEATDEQSFCLSSDDSKLYLLNPNTVFQYDLSTPGDLSTGAYASKSFSTFGEESNAKALDISSDSTKIYVIGSANNTVYQYTLSTAGDASTGTYASKSVANNVAETAPRGLGFSSDGLRLFTSGFTTDLVRQFTMSTAWDVSTGSDDSITLDVSNEDSDPYGIYFKGPELYVMGVSSDTVYQYYWTFLPNENMTWVDGVNTGNLGVVISTTIGATNTVIRFGYWNQTDHIPTGATVTGDDSGASFSATPTFAALQDIATDQSDYFDQLYAASTILRSAITPVPGSGVVPGIKWYKNQQTAVRDYFKFVYSDGDIAEPQIGQHVLIADGGASTDYGDEGIVRDLDLTSGSFSLGTGAGCIVIDPLGNSFDFSTKLGTGAFENTLITLSEVYFTSGSTEPTVDQQLIGQTSAKTATVYRVQLHSGAWADGDAVGVIYCTNLNGVLTSGELMDLVSPSTVNVLTAGDVNFGASGGPNINYASTDNDGHSMAGLYRSSRTGWNKVELGWEIRFDTGTTEPDPVKFGADTDTQTVVTTDWLKAGTQRDLTGWAASAGSELDAVNSSGGAYVFPDEEIGHLSVEEARNYFAVNNFGFDLPEGARVVGVEIEITAKNTAAATSGGAITKVQPYTDNSASYEGGVLNGVVAKRQALGDLTTSQVAYAFGGENDLWGSVIDKDTVESSDFGLKFKLEWGAATAGTAQQCDLIRMRIHYVEQGSLIYFHDTVAVADYTTARLVHFNLESGAWADNDAVGTMQIYDLLKSQIPTKNIQIRDTAAGAGNLIANLDGNESLLSLPGSSLLAAEKSKYEMIAENVYARDDLEAVYAASGAGRAFSYDRFYVRQINTGLSPDLDKPRHVELFQFRLWLGFKFGEMAISVAGDPLSFDGSLNAVATGFGRPITGLTKLPGKTMGVLTDQVTYTVTVGLDGSNFDQQVLSHRNGAIEYTVQDVGNMPIYVDPRGVPTPFSTDRYADFEIARTSHKIHPWLLERLQGLRNDSIRDNRIVAVSVARLKSQYRMYFADGYRLTMTIFGDQVAAEYSIQKLYTDATESQFIKVLATDADVDDDNRDRIFFTMDVNPDYDHGDDLGFVYEDDRGTSFNGDSYKRWIELNALSGKYLYEDTTWSVWHLYGMAHGWANLSVTTAVTIDENFAHPLDADSTTEDSEYDIKLGAPDHAVTTKLLAFWDKDAFKGNGKLLSLRFQNESDRELPHILQHITLVDEKAGRKDK